MSLDLYPDETQANLDRFPGTTTPEANGFAGFAKSTGMAVMRTLGAETARAASLAASTVPIAIDAFGGGTGLTDKYFKFHDEVFGDAVDFWTPRPEEVSKAGEITGQLLGSLPLLFISPAALVAKTQLSAAEDLTRQGVSPEKAQAVGAVQAAGLGVGIWVPILGKTLTQRLLVGGAGFNVLQGVATRGASEAILQDTPAAESFKAFDPQAMTLDALLGIAFGSLAHLSPSQRAQGAAFWERMQAIGKDITPEQVDALASLRQSQHLNADSLAGKPVDQTDIGAHVDRMRAAIDQLARDQPVNVEGMPAARLEPDAVRMAENTKRAATMASLAERIRSEEGLPEPPPVAKAEQTPVEQPSIGAKIAGAVKKIAEAVTPSEKPAADPVVAEAQRFVSENPNVKLNFGTADDGTPVTRTAKDVLSEASDGVKAAKDKARLFDLAAKCLLGGA